MGKILVTGIGSGLGKYLYENLPNTLGLSRDNFNLIKDEDIDVVPGISEGKIEIEKINNNIKNKTKIREAIQAGTYCTKRNS